MSVPRARITFSPLTGARRSDRESRLCRSRARLYRLREPQPDHTPVKRLWRAPGPGVFSSSVPFAVARIALAIQRNHRASWMLDALTTLYRVWFRHRNRPRSARRRTVAAIIMATAMVRGSTSRSSMPRTAALGRRRTIRPPRWLAGAHAAGDASIGGPAPIGELGSSVRVAASRRHLEEDKDAVVARTARHRRARSTERQKDAADFAQLVPEEPARSRFDTIRITRHRSSAATAGGLWKQPVPRLRAQVVPSKGPGPWTGH